MALSDFFRVNLPYGLKRNDNNEWTVFNREYMPLGYSEVDHRANLNNDAFYADKPYYTRYKGLTDAAIEKIITNSDSVQRDKEGRIDRFFLYNDGTNPRNDPKQWDAYLSIIKALSRFEVMHNSFA